MKRLALLLSLLVPGLANAQTEFVKATTDILCLVPSAGAAVLTLVNKDEEGFRQFVLSTAVATCASYAMEAVITKPRPDGDGNHAMPSTHTMIAFNGASYLQQRYGWKWGVPAYAISTYVAWGRVYGQRHDVWDVLAGAALGAGCAFIFTRPFAKGKEITVSPAVMDGAKGISLAMRF